VAVLRRTNGLEHRDEIGHHDLMSSMLNKLPEVEDLTLVEREDPAHSIDIELSAEVRDTLQAEADRRGVTLEEYLRFRLTDAAVALAVDARSHE
jgi:uncharacterized protein (DUF2249 family)